MGMPLMAVIMVVIVVMIVTASIMFMIVAMLMAVFMFHRDRFPSMLKCLHTPQAGEKNACP